MACAALSGRQGRRGAQRGAGTGPLCRLAACVLLLGAGAALPGAARADVLVSNIEQTTTITGASLGNHDHAQGFTTGTGNSGYKITSIRIRVSVPAGANNAVPRVRLFSQSANGTRLADFSGPSALTQGRRILVFTPTSPLVLDNSTPYWVTIEDEGGGEPVSLILTTSTRESGSSAPGWRIENTALRRTAGSTGNFASIGNLQEVTVRYVVNMRVDGTIRSVNSPATGKPLISGSARVGQLLTAARGTIDDANGVPESFDYQWIRVDGGNETAIPGANAETYRLTDDDEGKTLRVTLSFVDNDGYPEARTSDPYPASGTVDPQSVNSPATGKPLISGTARVGRLLTAARGTVDDANGVPEPESFDYQWIRVDGLDQTAIPGANAKTYRLTGDDEGKTLRVTLSFVDNAGYPEARTSDPYPASDTVDPQSVNSPATGKPVISGTARVGRLLTAARGTVDDADGMPEPESFDYQWIRVDGLDQTAIPGANAKTYRLTGDDEGKTLRVTLSFVDNAGYPEARTSDPYPASDTVDPQSVNSPATGKPVISGTARVGRLLTAARGTVDDADGMPVPESFDYQWIRVDGLDQTAIPGANAKTYRLTGDDEGKTLRVTLSFVDNAGYPEARTSDPYPAKGTVARVPDEYSSEISHAWLARFARTVGAQAVDAIEARLRAPQQPGLAGTIAGQSVSGPADAAPAESGAAGSAPALAGRPGGTAAADDGPAFGSWALSGREALATTSLALTRDGADGIGQTVWSRGTASRFEGRQDGGLYEGEVTSAMLGADRSWGRALAGIMVSLAEGKGGYRTPAGSGRADAKLTAVFPYGRYALGDRVALWGLAGYGAGSMTLTPATRAPLQPDIDFATVAVGVRGAAIEGGGRRPAVTAKTDAMAVRARAERVPGLAATEARVTRLRLGLEGVRRFALEGGAALTPSLEIGMRRDGGDTETGAGVDAGAGLALADPARGLSAAFRARWLLAHDAERFRMSGLSATLSWHTEPESRRGLSFSLSQTLGDTAGGGAEALLARATLAGPWAHDAEDDAGRRRRLEARLAYGLGVRGGRWTARPELGLGRTESERELRLGWRIEGRGRGAVFDTRLEVTHRRADRGERPPDNHLGLTATARW